MPFDLASAQPVSKGFDLASAKPVDQSGKAQSATKQPSAIDYAAAVPETLAQLASGTASTIAGGLAGLADIPLFAAGISKTSPADVVSNIQQAGTYQPRTLGGQTTANVVGYLPGKLAQGAELAGGAVTDLTGSPALGAAVNTGIQGVPMILGTKFAPKFGGAAKAVTPEVAEATNAGLRLTPEQAGTGVMGTLGKAVQSLTGGAKLERMVSKKNAPVVNNLAKQDIGIAPGQPLNQTTIDAARQGPNSIYKAVSQVGQVPTDARYAADIAGIANRTGAGSFAFDVPPEIERLRQGYGGVQSFDAGDAIAKVRQLRKDASSNIKAPNAPERNALGYAQQQIADAIENQLDRHIQSGAAQGVSANLIDQFRAARQQLAKIKSVEDALDGPNVSAKELNKQLNRGVPLSGNLRTIANAYGNFDRSLQDVSKIRNSGPFSALDTLVGAPLAYLHPGLLGTIALPPLARGVLASRAFQRAGIQRLATPPSFPGLLGAGSTLPLLADQRGLMGEAQ